MKSQLHYHNAVLPSIACPPAQTVSVPARAISAALMRRRRRRTCAGRLVPPALIPELEDPALAGRARRLTWNIRDMPYGQVPAPSRSLEYSQLR